MFSGIWRQGLLDYDAFVGIDWEWLAADGAMTKAPLGGPKTGPNPTDRAKKGRNVRFSEAAGVPVGLAQDGANRHDEVDRRLRLGEDNHHHMSPAIS